MERRNTAVFIQKSVLDDLKYLERKVSKTIKELVGPLEVILGDQRDEYARAVSWIAVTQSETCGHIPFDT
jgi:hypothetical protein